MTKKTKLLILTGATATGKSALAVSIAKQTNASIIGCDSMQIYRGLNIGTGKISESEKQGVPHYMIDIVDPSDNYSVSQYVEDTQKNIEDISAKGQRIIIAGGTGLYISALTQGYNLASVPANPKLREQYQAIVDEKGSEFLHKMLLKKDISFVTKIFPNDTKRIIRALEILESAERTKPHQITENPNAVLDKYDILQIVLDCDRAVLYDRINKRVDSMIANGLEEEVRGLEEYRDCQSMKAIGYRQFIEYFDGLISKDDCIAKIKQHSRNYAKRQITYFKHMQSLNKQFVDVDYGEKILELAQKHLLY
ncbi:MAG: tRNA (adenosine(37)-N6)-dimethylallyltransferase MiaA [Firmicutes bacterium]|nr:tRNA (adenosine(37)-N6)-dimethylallyltransferase MiaA [Bacillota bacterium]